MPSSPRRPPPGRSRRRSPRVGFLGPTPAAAVPHLVEAFRQGLRDLGYVEGQTIAIEYRWAEGRFERLAGLASELAALDIDVLVAPTPPAVRGARPGPLSVLEPLLHRDRSRIIELAAKHRLPAIYQWREHAEEGA